MFGIKSLVNTETCIFNPPPPGKPDPIFFYDGKTPRERVVQEAQKGIDCWYTVMGWLEPTVGLFYDKKFEALKCRQKLMNERCDVLRNIEDSLESLNVIYLALKKHHKFESIDKERAKNLLEGRFAVLKIKERQRVREALRDFLKQNLTDDFNQFIKQNSLESLNVLYLALKEQNKFESIDKERAKNLLEGPFAVLNRDERQRVREALRDFLEQNLIDDFNEFIIVEYQKRCNLCEKLFIFDALGPTAKENLSNFILDTYKNGPLKYLKKEWEELSRFEKMWALRAMSIMTCGALCDFNGSTWNPRKKVTDLIQEIKNSGPLMVQGCFGRPMYKSNPVEIDKVAGRSIWEWSNPDEIDVEMCTQFHPILIVGARSDTTTGHVYFVDALDRSDPFDPAPPPVYRMSYLMLRKGIASIEGVKIPLEAIKEDRNDYAWSAKKFKGYI